MKIGIIGEKTYPSKSKVYRLIKMIYDELGPSGHILNGGVETGAEQWAKKMALEFSMKFTEYNPAYTGKRLYSAMEDSYYEKGYHMSHIYDRYRRLIIASDKVVLFTNTKKDPVLQYCIKQLEKLKKKYVIVS